MLFRRIACVGLMMAVVAAGVLQVRLMKGAALREIHLLVSQRARLQRQIASQNLELAQLRAPWRVADRLSDLRMDILPPAANRPSVEPRKPVEAVPEATVQPDSTEPVTQTTHSGDAARKWPSHPPQKNVKKPGR